MAARKSERLMNLVIALLVARTYVTKDRLREVVEGYREQSTEAFERMFERDKDELREMGIPIEVGSLQRGFDDEVGYRVRRSDFALPEILLTPDEAAVVGLAARVWQHASLAEATSQAVVKLRAAGVDADPSALAAVEPHLAATDPAFDPLWEAVLSRSAVTFQHRRPGAAEPRGRRLEPWGIVSWHGHWYVVGHDRDRDAPRMFRLSRITGPVATISDPDAFEVPAGTDVRALVDQLAPADPTGTARLKIRVGAGFGLRRRAVGTAPAVDGWDAVELPFADPVTLAEEIASYGPDVVAVDPPEVRQATVRHLASLAGGP